MKKHLLYIILMLSGNLLMAQKDCSDAVHPTLYRASILNCCIKDIKEGNIVVYAKEGIIYEIEAVAINLNKAYYVLKEPNDSLRNIVLLESNPAGTYDGHPYEYYQELYNKAAGNQLMGITLSVVGGGLLIGGVATMSKKYHEYDAFNPDDDTNINGAGFIFSLLGVAGLGVGIPTAITNGVKKKKHKAAMEEIKNQHSLSLSLTKNGLGLTFHF